MDQPKYLRRQASAEYLRRVWGIEIAPSTLAKMCGRRRGPKTVHSGRVALHGLTDLDDFARAYLKTPSRSTFGVPTSATLPPIAPTAGEWRPTA
jgi:hypothetical protein